MPEDGGLIRVDEESGPGRGAGHRRQRPLHACSTPTRAPSWRWPRPTATWPRPGPRPLAVTNCLNFGSPEDPGVMWQFAEAVRGLADGCASPGRAGHRGQRQLLQPDRLDRDQAHPGDRGAGGARRRAPAPVHRLRRPRAPRSCCSAGPGTSSAARPGPRSCTGTWAAARRGWTSRPSRPWPGCWPTRRAAGVLTAAHDLSDGGLAVALAESCLRGGLGARVDAARRPVHGPVQRVGRPGRGRGATRRRGRVRPAVRRAGRARGDDRRRRRHQPGRGRLLHGPAGRAGRGPPRHRCPPSSAPASTAAGRHQLTGRRARCRPGGRTRTTGPM